MINVGDRIEVESEKVGSATRCGEVIALEGRMLRVRWDDGRESMYVPSAGAVRVIEKRTTSETATP